MTGVFVGIGMMAIFLSFAYLVYQVTRYVKISADKEEKYELFEGIMLEEVAKKKGIDLQKEMIKREAWRSEKKSIRMKMRDEIYKELFGDDKEEEKKEEDK